MFQLPVKSAAGQVVRQTLWVANVLAFFFPGVKVSIASEAATQLHASVKCRVGDCRVRDSWHFRCYCSSTSSQCLTDWNRVWTAAVKSVLWGQQDSVTL